MKQQSFGSIQEENLGTINFSLHFNSDQGLLTVKIIQARDLVPRDFSGTSDPYCRICLLPNRKTQLQTRTHRKTVCPEFNEEFMFAVLPADLPSRTVEILIYDYDQFSRDECIGQVHLPMENLDLSEKVTLWKGISAFEKKDKEVGIVFFVELLSIVHNVRYIFLFTLAKTFNTLLPL